MKDKYIDEVFHPWFIFGKRTDGSGVDISNGNEDVLEGVSEEHAKIIIEERDKLLAALNIAIQEHNKRDYEVFKMCRDLDLKTYYKNNNKYKTEERKNEEK